MFDITLTGALIAGLLSFLSPCVLPLVPPYLCFLAGTTLDKLVDDETPSLSTRLSVIFQSIAFVLGFTTVFVALGSTATFLGDLFASHMQLLSSIAGVLIIVLGVHFLGLFKITTLFKDVRFDGMRNGKTGLFGAYIVGLAFAFGWTPCIGPILASILIVAGSEESVGEGMVLLLAYSAGIGIPFIVAAAFTGWFMSFAKGFRRYFNAMEKVVGGLLVITGILFLTDGMAEISFWLLEYFPALGQQG